MLWNSLTHNGIAVQQLYTFINAIVRYKGMIIKSNNELESALYLFSKTNKKYKDTSYKVNFLRSIKNLLPSYCTNLNHIQFQYESVSSNKVVNLEKYKYCCINGKKEELDRFIAEPAYIFIGRGNHILRGTFKPAVKQCDIILNCSKKHAIPGKWKKVVCNKNVNWIAAWFDPITKKYKYVYPNSNSKTKLKSTIEKFDFARKVNNKLHLIRKKISTDLLLSDQKILQHAVATYLIDKLCLRCGNEVEDYNTFGCTTLLCKHLKVNGSKISLDFLGKDSIPFSKSIICADKNILQFLKYQKRNLNASDQVFDKITSSSLNTYLDATVPGLTAKVFRTCHATTLFSKLLEKSSTLEQFKEANKKVADLCNHTNLQTSKANYIDPRVIYKFSKDNNINVTKLMNPVLIKKFEWAKN